MREMRPKMATKNQLAAIHSIRRARGWTDNTYLVVLENWSVQSSRDLTSKQASEFISTFGTRTPQAPQPAPKGHRYGGFGQHGEPNSNLTQDQADAIAKYERLLGWNKNRTMFAIQKYLHKSCGVEMLMQFEARKLIHIMSRLLDHRNHKAEAAA